jgi:hypothetical protein
MSTWTLGTASGDITVDGVLNELYTARIGDTINPTLWFPRRSGGESAESRWKALLPFVRHASDQVIRAGTTSGDTGFYREDTSGLPIDSFLVSVEPPVDLDFAGVWGVIVGGTDQSEPSRSVLRWQLEIVVLAELGDFADRASAESALKEVLS